MRKKLFRFETSRASGRGIVFDRTLSTTSNHNRGADQRRPDTGRGALRAGDADRGHRSRADLAAGPQHHPGLVRSGQRRSRIILSSGPIGLIMGGVGVGFLADRIGRRNALIAAMVLMTVATARHHAGKQRPADARCPAGHRHFVRWRDSGRGFVWCRSRAAARAGQRGGASYSWGRRAADCWRPCS